MKTAVVTGAGGFIGSHFVKFLKKKGYTVRGIDIVKPSFSDSDADEFILADLRDLDQARQSISAADELYMFAADMGGIGYISAHHADLMRNNILINSNSLLVAQEQNIPKIFFASSACIYPVEKQLVAELTALKESDAIPANPDSEYGWEKLFTEQLCLAYRKDYGIDVKIARFHNIYGPEGTYNNDRAKSPADICRKVAEAKDGGTVEVWGDGKQSRSYCYIDDCCEGVYRLVHSDVDQPINIGSDELITINDLVTLVSKIAKKKLKIKHQLDKPQGVRGRNSDNTLIQELLGWAPPTSLKEGFAKTYRWINTQVNG